MPHAQTKRALLIAGPTASGKSALALKLARERGGVIINADALQVYRDLRILSARPTPEEETGAPHRLYGHVSGSESYSTGRWLADVGPVLDEAWRGGFLPIVVGGTGLYFNALERGLAEVPSIPGEVRERWRDFAGDLYAELSGRDPEGALLLNPNDRQRLIRALEVIEGTGKSLRHWQQLAQGKAPLAGIAVERIFLDIPRTELHARAEARFDRMLANGALEEVRPLLGLDPMLPMMKAIGVPELAAHLRGEITLDEATTRAKAATRQYIKRQLTWWRGQMKGWGQVSIHAKETS
jgi:tRNA dimethylallyltransferase